MQVQVKTLAEDRDHQLDLQLIAGALGVHRELGDPRVQRLGLALAGFTDSINPKRVQILGKTEYSYLSGLDPQSQTRALQGVVNTGLVCVVLTSDLAPLDQLTALADEHDIPVFRTTQLSGTVIQRLERSLGWILSDEVTLHGVFLDVYGVGVLLMGPSSIGKSECALDLVLRGHSLIADDVVHVRRQGERLTGTGSPLTRHHMEVRGLGIINVRDLFGAASVRERKRIELLVEMSEWKAGEMYDRMGIDDRKKDILGLSIPKVSLPIRPGRNIASIVEVAARNHLLKLQGHHSAREFKDTLERRLAMAAQSLSTPEPE